MAILDTHPLGQFDKLFDQVQVIVPSEDKEHAYVLQYIQCYTKLGSDDTLWAINDIYELDEDGDLIPISWDDNAWAQDIDLDKLGKPTGMQVVGRDNALCLYYC